MEDKSSLKKCNSHINIIKSATGKNPTKLGTLARRGSEKKLLQLSLTNSKIIRAL